MLKQKKNSSQIIANDVAQKLKIPSVPLDIQSDATNKTRNHRARGVYAYGRIYLDAARFSPQTFDGKRLIAHEVVHAAQDAVSASSPQGTGSSVEAEAQDNAIRYAQGASLSPAQAKLPGHHLAAESPVELVSSENRPKTRFTFGECAIEGMEKIHRQRRDTGIWYPGDYASAYPDVFKQEWVDGYADERYWVRQGHFHWVLKEGASASEAIEAFLHGLTIAECQPSIFAIQLDTVRQIIGDDQFNKLFGYSEGGPLTQRLTILYDNLNVSLGDLWKPTEAGERGVQG